MYKIIMFFVNMLFTYVLVMFFLYCLLRISCCKACDYKQSFNRKDFQGSVLSCFQKLHEKTFSFRNEKTG